MKARAARRFGREGLVAMAAAVALAALGSAGCQGCKREAPGGSTAPSASASVAEASDAGPAAPRKALHLPREGSVIARTPAGDALLVADEDHRALRIVPLPLDAAGKSRSVAMPGAPAQIVTLDGPGAGRVLVTIRDPGLVLVLEPDAQAGLVERARVEVPADAWGVTVTPDGKAALVSSAWSHRVTAVDLATAKARWSIDVRREPRAIVVREGGATAYVTHLVGAAITKLDGLEGEAPKVTSIDLPPSPLRTPSGRTLDAALAYSAALAPGGDRLFVARHAIGALGTQAWFGASTVDVMLTEGDTALAPKHFGRLPFLRADQGVQGDEIKLPGGALSPLTQPRAIVFRKKTETLLVASEGDDALVELDALSVDPTLAVVRTYKLGVVGNAVLPVATSGGAPAGLVVSDDESTAWVFCRSTYDVAEIALGKGAEDAGEVAPPRLVRVAEDDLDMPAATGRRLFYNASDRVTSGGLACAGCHPEGRDDGHVWHQAKINTAEGAAENFLGEAENAPDEDHVKGYARRTPILAGRVGAAGPYGWHGESATIEERMQNGFALHRWSTIPKHEPANLAARAGFLAAFLRKGLVPPPKPARDLTPDEEKGRAIFVSEEAKCARCHVPTTGFTDRSSYPMKLGGKADFDDEENAMFKVPSLLFVGGHGALLHDGSARTLEDLVERNGDRMGKTSHLDAASRAALIAYLRTL